LTDLDDADAFAADLQGFLDASGIPLEAQTWEQLSSEYQSIAGFYGAFSGLSGIAIFALVFFSTLEILTMSFLERTRETGTLRALGTGRPRVFRTFLLEGILLGVFGGACGAALGVALALVFNAIGVGWMPPGAAMPQTLRLQVDAMIVLVPLLTAIGSTAIASIYPATKNARLPVVDALRSV
jgi:putative ABC transport system permease protein